MHPNDRLIELINRWHTFEVANPGAGIPDFCRFYLTEQAYQSEQPAHLQNRPVAMRLGRAFGRLAKFSQWNSKQLMANLGLANFEDWLYLLVLVEMGMPKKSELIHEMLSDFTTGIEIIKRLVKAELVEEFPDPDDKRSKRLKITAKGEEALALGIPRMAEMSQQVFAPLSEEERRLTLMLLNKLDAYHTERWLNLRRNTPHAEEP